MLNPAVSDALLQRLQDAFPADIVGMASLSHDRIQQTIGEQRVLKVLQAWHDEEDPLLGGQ